MINIEQAWAQYFTHISATCVHSARCGTNLVMEPDGKLYACDHLINSQHYLGQLANNTLAPAVDSATRLPFGIKKSQRRECQRCSVKIVCQEAAPHISTVPATTDFVAAITLFHGDSGSATRLAPESEWTEGLAC